MGIFDTLIASVTAEDRAVIDRYPALKTSMEKLETDYNTVSTFANGWVDWQKKNWDPQAGMTVAEVELRKELATATAQLTARGASEGADPEELSKLRKDFETKLADVQRNSLQAIEGMNMFYGATAKHMLPHQQEFKENLDPQALMKYMQDNKIQDPDIAYDRMVAGKRTELAAQAAKDLEAKHAQEIVDAEKRGADKRAQELAMGPAGLQPTDSTGGIAGVTARVDAPLKVSDELKAKLDGAKLGDGSLAALGYDMYRSGQFQGPVQ